MEVSGYNFKPRPPLPPGKKADVFWIETGGYTDILWKFRRREKSFAPEGIRTPERPLISSVATSVPIVKLKEMNLYVHKHTWSLCKYTRIWYCYGEVNRDVVTEIDTSRSPISNTATGCDPGPFASIFLPHLLSHYSILKSSRFSIKIHFF